MNPVLFMLPSFTLNRVIGSNFTFIVSLSPPVISSYLACSHSACDGSNWFSSAGA